MGLQVKGKFVSVHASNCGITSIAPLKFSMDEWLSSRPCRCTPQGKNSRYPLNRRLGGPSDGLDVWRRDVSCPYRDPKTKSPITWPIQDTEFPNIRKPNLCPMLKISKRLDPVQVPHNRELMMKIRYVAFSKEISKLLRYRVYKTSFRKTSLCSNARCKATCNPLTSIHLFLFRKSV
jgi:hypothetical protein